MTRLYYSIVQTGIFWTVRTEASWPDALSREFSSQEEALAVATIAARIEWKNSGSPTGVCVTNPATGHSSVEAEFG
jgi:hypothetical protein